MKALVKIIIVLFFLCAALFFSVRTLAAEGDAVITLWDGDEVYATVVAEGGVAKPPVPPKREGYRFLGWRVDSREGEAFEWGGTVNDSISLYSSYELLPPTYEIDDISFVYDGSCRTLGFKSLTHPLLSSGIISYEWYKDGSPLGFVGSSLSIKNVSDSGRYSCKITFTHSAYSVSTTTPDVYVEVKQGVVDLPSIRTESYTGEPIMPEIFDTGLYFVEKSAKTLAGVYPICITLKDSQNFTFSGVVGEVAYVDFIIKPAENLWTSEPRVDGIFEGSALDFSASARFGTPTFYFSLTADGTYTSSPPTKSGTYYYYAEVLGTDNYSELKSEIKSFTISAEEASGIRVVRAADKMSYRAFELFNPTGLEILVSYNSGRSEVFGAADITVSYQNGTALRYGDGGVVISYLGYSDFLPLEVTRAEYDLSGLTLNDITVEYNGTVPSVQPSGTLPTGLDGIALSYRVIGAGSAVGTYNVTLEFYTESKDYKAPPPLTATLTVTPLSVDVIWSSISFVYDGTLKLPTAYYTDIYGRRIGLTVSGARSYAGLYSATVCSPDTSYSFNNPSIQYEIKKASYDMSGALWVGGGEVYNGKEHRVYLTGLPEGVSVIGYLASAATEAGEYTARAAFSYDSANYNPPIAPDYPWLILPAEYEQVYSFSDATYIYDGEIHYPTFTGYMPVGADGIALSYTLSGGAKYVDEGRVEVIVTYHTQSKNYLPPPPEKRYVTITPAPITVEWHNTEFCYTGDTQAPYSVAKECSITVTGGECDAGDYIAYAVADNTNYSVINNECPYVIKKAENGWIILPGISDTFFGKPISPVAEALVGRVEYFYYRDADCTEATDGTPTECGVYYLVAKTAGDKNHLPISSQPVSFEIIPIIPVSLNVTLFKEKYVAFDTVAFLATVLNNDGSEVEISCDEIAVLYQSASSFRFGDSSVGFCYDGLTVNLPITVAKKDYDLSAVRWTGTIHEYDGTAKHAVLVGLPEGIEIIGYVGNGVTLAGEYTVSAIIEYDRVNYTQPVINDTTLTVNKMQVPVPTVPPVFYNSLAQYPVSLPSGLYTVELDGGFTDAGEYPITLVLSDPDNYTFSGEDSIRVIFTVLPAPITVKISDCTLYLFERDFTPSFTVMEGRLFGSDTLIPTYTATKQEISAEFDNENYDVTVINGKIERIYKLSEASASVMLTSLFITAALLFVIAVIIVKRKDIKSAFMPPHDDGNGNPPTPPPPSAPPPPLQEDNGTEAPEESDEEDIIVPVSIEYADATITDGLAKSLIRREGEVRTNGYRRGIVNIDTLSRAFLAGERVDVNTLKSHSLIPYDTAYIKVLARGMIDKPLTVCANDFSLAAVKMIALTGGRAIKVNTVVEKYGGGRNFADNP